MTLTKSMREWLEWIAAGGVIEGTATGRPVAAQCRKKITWAMLDKLEDSGLIAWGAFSSPFGKKSFYYKCRALLTASGHAAIMGEAERFSALMPSITTTARPATACGASTRSKRGVI